MMMQGDFVTPQLGGLPWLEKPPLLFWLETASYSAFGVSEWSARLPSALLALGTIGMACVLLVRVGRPRAARLVVLILPTAPLWAAFARTASTDMPLVACLSIALMAAYLAAREDSMGWTAVSGLALGLGILAKGPVSLVLYGMIGGTYSILARRWIWSPRQLAVAGALALVVSAPWFWLVWRANGSDFVATFVINHHVARYLTAVHRHQQPFWFYGGVILLGFFPWVVFLGSAAGRLRHKVGTWKWEESPLEPFLWLWVAAPVLFFSLSQSKLAGYVMPVFPALALLAALQWDRFLEGDIQASKAMRRQLVLLLALVAALVIVLIQGGLDTYATLLGGLLAIPLVAGCWGAWSAFGKGRRRLILLHLVASMAVLLAMAYWLVAPVLGPYHSLKHLVTTVRPALSAEQPLIQYRCFHHSALYYADYLATDDAVPDMVQLNNYFGAFPQEGYFLLVKQNGLSDLMTSLGELKSVRRAGPFYLVEFVPRRRTGP